MMWLQRVLKEIFDQSGGTWVGWSTFLASFMAFTEFVASGFQKGVPGWHPTAPAWYVGIPAGVYAFILGLFVLGKGTNYYVDSRYNTVPGQKPGDPPPAIPTVPPV